MREGVYRVYRLYPDEDRVQQRMVARFVLVGDRVEVLEDHDDLLGDAVPEGRLSDRAAARLDAMATSPYWRVVSEDDVSEGYHLDLLPELEEV